MQVHINGEPQALPGPLTLLELLTRLGLEPSGVAVAVNLSVVPRSAHGSTRLAEGDRVEILQAVGGG